MPSATVHLKVAYLMKDELGIKNDADFYMGAIAPDAVNLDGFADEEHRYSAHVRSKNYQEWKDNIKAFYNIQKDSFESPDYLKGYIFHLYTDIAWDDIVQPALFSFLNEKGFSPDEFREQKWLELFRLNKLLSKQTWYAVVRDKVTASRCYEMLGVPQTQVEKYRDYVVGAYETEKMLDELPLFLNENHIFAATIKAGDYAGKLF